MENAKRIQAIEELFNGETERDERGHYKVFAGQSPSAGESQPDASVSLPPERRTAENQPSDRRPLGRSESALIEQLVQGGYVKHHYGCRHGQRYWCGPSSLNPYFDTRQCEDQWQACVGHFFDCTCGLSALLGVPGGEQEPTE